MNAPKVSVMMTIYNAERYLRQAIDSMLAQRFSAFELLAVDDASTDASAEILRSYRDSRFRVVRNLTKRRVACSRQFALQVARGEYVAVLDADDVSSPERLRVQVEYLEHHPEIDLVGSGYQVINEEGKTITTRAVPTEPLEIRWKLLFGNCIGHSTVMYRRERALQIGGYDERVAAGEDFDLWVRFATYGKIAQLDSPLAQWRHHAASLQNTEPLEVKQHFIWTVVKSIQLQTGLAVDFDVAQCLYRDTAKPSPDPATLLRAYATIGDCLSRFLGTLDLGGAERNRLRSFALEENFRVGLQNPGSFRDAWRAAASWVDKRDLSAVLTRRVVRRAVVSACPGWVIQRLRKAAL